METQKIQKIFSSKTINEYTDNLNIIFSSLNVIEKANFLISISCFELNKEENIKSNFVDPSSIFLNNLHIVNQKNTDLFLNLFFEGLTWADLIKNTIKLQNKSISLLGSNLLSLKYNLFQSSFKSFFLKECFDKQYPFSDKKHLRLLGLKFFSCDYFTEQEDLIQFWDFFEFGSVSKFKNEFLNSINSWNKLIKLPNSFNISPLDIVEKKQLNIYDDVENLEFVETFLFANIIQKTKEKKIKLNENNFLFNFIKENKKEIITRNTEKTSNLDLVTRIAFAFSFMKDENDYNKILNILDIKKLNLDCKDYHYNPKQIRTIKDALIETGKIKTFTKFNKGKEQQSIPIDNLLLSKPQNPNLITTKKAFLKNWLMIDKENINFTKVLESVINSQYKHNFSTTEKNKYDLYLKFYFPIKNEYANLRKEDFEEIKSNNKKINYFLPIENGSDSSFDCFINFLTYLHEKKINWNEQLESGSTIGEQTILLTFKLHSILKASTRIGTDNHIFIDILKALDEKSKVNIFTYIKDNFEDILPNNKLINFTSSYYVDFNIRPLILIELNSVMSDIISNKIVLDKNIFDINYKTMYEKIKSASNSGLEDLVKCAKNLEIIELYNTLESKNNINKKIKI